jgi:hypothetical protein
MDKLPENIDRSKLEQNIDRRQLHNRTELCETRYEIILPMIEMIFDGLYGLEIRDCDEHNFEYYMIRVNYYDLSIEIEKIVVGFVYDCQYNCYECEGHFYTNDDRIIIATFSNFADFCAAFSELKLGELPNL